MDLTILFGACVKTVRTTNKLIGVKDPKTNILKTTKRDANLHPAKEIVKQTSMLESFFNDHRGAYMNVVNCLSTGKTMTEVERIEIDTKAQEIINACTTMINDYRKWLAKYKGGAQSQEHYANVIASAERYLKEVSRVYAEAKAIRVKKVIDMHKISKLETTPSKQQSPVERKAPVSPTDDKIENELSAEELQMFESENDALYSELNSLSDEVRQMESKVVHIAELQELFTEKVLQQEKDIDRIANVVAATTDDIKDGNEQIRQSIQRNAGLRVWVLFFLLVMSLSLLFLDWYND